MKLGMDFPSEWKTLSEKNGIAISDILYGYAVEDLMVRLEKSSFHESLWLMREDVLTEAAYAKTVKDRLAFYYKITGRKPLTESLLETLMEEIKEQDRHGIFWTHTLETKAEYFLLHLEAHYKDMIIPVTMTVENVPENAQSPKLKSMELAFVSKKICKYYSYSIESVLAEALFEMLRKLELIGDMSVYHTADEILQKYSISGRHILEEFKYLGEKEPKVISHRRLEQIKSYKTYAYMEKKWQQYEKRQGRNPEEWSQVLEKILRFLDPTWTALCNNDIFFADWMPELGRFLG